MNFARIAAAAVVAWIVSLPVGYLVNDVLLVGVNAANAGVLRPEADMMAKLPLGFGGLLIAFFAFAYMYAKGYEGGSGVVEGIRFGVLVALMVIGFGWIWMYVSVPITGSLSIASMIDSLVELPLYGAIVGAVYKPLPAPAARAAAI